MATLDTTRSFSDATSGARISGLFASAFGALSAWNDARVTRNSLSRLSARELDDIGLCRGDIETIATQGSRF